MRFAFFIVAGLALSACQLAAPAVENTPDVDASMADLAAQMTPEQTTSAQADTEKLAAAFAEASAAAKIDTTPKKGVFGFLQPKSAPSVLAGTDIEVIDGSTEAETDATQTPDADATEIAAGSAGEPTQRAGIFGFLKPKTTPVLADVEAEIIPAESTEIDPEDAAETDAAPALDDAQTEATSEADALPVKKKGFLSFLAPRNPATNAALAMPKIATPPLLDASIKSDPADDITGDIATKLTSVDPEKNHRPLFGFLKSNRNVEKQLSTVAEGDVIPFGEVGILCGFKKTKLGHAVDKFPREGNAVWRLYDAHPENTGPHTQFITGFSDGCARQITAALVTFGAPGLHEVHRYSASMKNEPWTEGDNAYERAKVKICGVARKENCPEDKLNVLEQKLAFVTAYPTFGSNGDWLELLLNEGHLVTQERR